MKTRTITHALALSAALAAPAGAQVLGNRPWTTVGATGTFSRPDDLANVTFDNAGWIQPGPNETYVIVRYNITAVDGLFETAGPLLTRPYLRVRFRDPGEGARVGLTLREYDPADPDAFPITNRILFDSNTYAGNADFQTRAVSCTVEPFNFDFANKAYFLEARLTRTTDGPFPALAYVQIGRTSAGCIDITP